MPFSLTIPRVARFNRGGTLLEFGHADLRVYRASYREKGNAERAIEVPIYLPSGAIVVGGPEDFDNARTIELGSGHYKLVAAQRVVSDGQEEIELYFERLTQPLGHSRIVVADIALHPSDQLIETVEIA